MSELEKEVLAFPLGERELLATVAWKSLVVDPGALSDPALTPKGLSLNRLLKN
jgi:hypothetical protein